MGTAPQSAMPPLYLSMFRENISLGSIGGMCAARQTLAGFPYFAVASALCWIHQYLVPPSRRLPTATTLQTFDVAARCKVGASVDEKGSFWTPLVNKFPLVARLDDISRSSAPTDRISDHGSI
jgi:hypothetical protein